jgi:hypothetical protein
MSPYGSMALVADVEIVASPIASSSSSHSEKSVRSNERKMEQA